MLSQKQVNINNPNTYLYSNSSYLKELKQKTDRKIAELYKEDLPKLDLIDYIKEGWKIVVPNRPFINSWSIEAIAEHLQAVSKGEITRLLINIAPRHTKSLICSVFWPTWEWTQNPYTQWLTLSYGLNLSIRDARKSRLLIQSNWYQQNWSKAFTFAFDQNVKSRYENNLQGHRVSSAMLASMTGENADRILIDDPHNVADIESETIRQSTIDAYDLAISTRLNDANKGSIVVIGQRLREDDLFGHLLAQGGFEHLCLPSENDLSRRCFTSVKTTKGKIYTDPVTGTFRDPRTKEKELLSPERFDEKAIEKAKKVLQPIGYAAQHDQNPTPPTGVLFNTDKLVKINPSLIPFDLRKHRHWDLASTVPKNGSDPDYTVGVLMGIDDTNNRFFVLDVVRFRLEPAQAQVKILKTAQDDGLSVSITVEEEKASAGKHVAAAWTTGLLKGFIFTGQPIQGDKVARARAFAAQMNAGNVYVPSDALWLFDYVKELKPWPNTRHKDQGDGSSGAFNELTKNNVMINPTNIITFEITDSGITIVNGKNPGFSIQFKDLRDIGFISYSEGHFSISRIWLDASGNRHIVECLRRKTHASDALELIHKLHGKRPFEIFGIDQKLYDSLESEINQSLDKHLSDTNPLPLYPIELETDRAMRQQTAIQSGLMTQRITASSFIQRQGNVWSQILNMNSVEDDARDSIAGALILAEKSY